MLRLFCRYMQWWVTFSITNTAEQWVKTATFCWAWESIHLSFHQGWQEDQGNKVRGTETRGWRWCTPCSSGSRLDSRSPPPAKHTPLHQNQAGIENMVLVSSCRTDLEASGELLRGAEAISLSKAGRVGSEKMKQPQRSTGSPSYKSLIPPLQTNTILRDLRRGLS